MQTVGVFDRTVQKTHEWLTELAEIGEFTSETQAYTALRAVLHSLRDRLVVDEAAALAAELPMLVRGIYFEGWKPALAPNRERTMEAFLDSVRESLRGANWTIDAEQACRAVFQLLTRRISAGEIRDVRSMLPGVIQELWPKPPEGVMR
jgi:uncharacterized protein (DUF2267 family)